MKSIIIGIIALVAVVGGGYVATSLEQIPEGTEGVVYTYSKGAKEETIKPGVHFVGPFAKVNEYPTSQQQIVFSNNPSDYGKKEHADWHIDAPANGGMVSLNLTVNYNFLPDRLVDLYKRFKGMDGDAIVESMVQNSIVAYVKEVTPQFTVMDIYSDKRSEVSAAITDYLNIRLRNEYGINVSSALIIDVQLNETLKAKIQAKEEAKQDAEKAELDRQTALAQAEVTKANAEAAAQVAKIEAEAQAEQQIIKAQSKAEAMKIEAEAEAEAISKVTGALTDEYIDYVTAENWNGELPKVQSGSGATIVDVGNFLAEKTENVG